MSYINVSSPTSRAVLQLSTASISTTSSGYVVPALQDITVNNQNQVFNWTQLDSQSQKSVATPATNSISGNFVLDSTAFFSGSNGVPGIFDLSADKDLVYFRVYFNGQASGAKYVSGQGYVTNLAMTVSPTAPVWVSPLTISVDGDLTAGTV
ncbi:MAG: hypothetical protein RJA42_296 [Bacteroidota bacterium]|jgi:hypothetical protein